MTIEITDKWVISLRFNEINKIEKNKIKWFLIDFIFCRLAETVVSGSPSVTWPSRKWRHWVWGVSAVAILDCSLNLYACGRQKALTMPAYCVAANCNNPQATQSITMYKLLRNRPAVRRKRRKWVKFGQFKRADYAAPHSRRAIGEHFTECGFVNFMAEYQMGFASKRN